MIDLEALPSAEEAGFGVHSRKMSMDLLGILDDDIEFRQNEMKKPAICQVVMDVHP